jgi:hypothetical protein
VAGLFLLPFPGSDYLSVVLGEYTEMPAPRYIAILCCCLVSLFWCAYISTGWSHQSRWIAGAGRLATWPVVLGCGLFQLLAWRWVSINSVTETAVWSVHLDATIYALSQAVARKILLLDLPSQYGLFPVLLAPLFKMTGLSVFSLTSVFAVMQTTSMAGLFCVMFKKIRLASLRVVLGIALVLLTFETTLYYAGFDEHYFQDWPIRFFWPALSVLLFDYFLHR